MTKLGTIVRTQVRTRFGPSNAYTVTLPGHWETDGNGARVLVDGGTHEATSTGTGALDWARARCKAHGIAPIETWKGNK